jgi:pyruvate carboxylase subunit B
VIYFVTIGEQTLTVEVDGARVTVDGRSVEARLDEVAGTPELRLAIDGELTSLALAGQEGLLWRLVDAGAVHEIAVEDERARHIRLLAGADRPVDRHLILKAPMPGLVLRVMAAVGESVPAGAPLVALEAMKMENELKAASAGVVSAVLVAPGQVVEKGQVLLELTPTA